MKTTKNLMIIFIIVILLTSISCNAFFKKKVITTKIYDEEIEKAVLSPDRKRLLIINDQKEIVLFDVQKEEIITRYDMVTEEYVIYKHSVDWVNSNEIELTKHYHHPQAVKKYITKDLKDFRLLYQINKSIKYRMSNTARIIMIQNESNNCIKFQYDNGDFWKIPLQFDYNGLSWSFNDRYLFLSNSKTKELYLIDTLEKKTNKIDYYFSGKWAPTQYFYCFYTEDFNEGKLKEQGLYIFNAKKLSFIRFTTNIVSFLNQSLSWSPDSRYILITNVSKMYLFYAFSPLQKPKVLVDFDGQLDSNRVAWSKDLKHVLFSYETRSINVLKPFNFYVARVNIDTGKMESLYIDGLLYKEFFWIDDNTIIYRVDHDNGLYKSELKW